MSKKKTEKDLYLKYPHRYDPRSPKYVDKNEHTKILNSFFRILSIELMEEGEVYKAPGMGEFRIKKFKAVNPAVDWKKTNELREKNGELKLIYHFNNHSDGMAARWHWNKEGARIKNVTLYRFTPVRANKRRLAQLIKNTNSIKKYLE